MKTTLKTAMIAAGISIFAALPCAAQTAPTPSTAGKTFTIKGKWVPLRFVDSRLMAFWLDPQNNVWPGGLGLDGAQKAAAIHLNFPKPAGVNRIFASGGLGGLLVDASDEGFREIREIVAVLDQPQHQIAVQARVLSIPSPEMTRFWADLSTLSNQNPPMPMRVNGAEENALGDLISRQKARIEAVRDAVLDQGASGSLDFGPPAPKKWRSDDLAPMPVVPLPFGLDEQFVRPINPSRIPSAPAPFDALRLQIAPTIQKEGAVALQIRFTSGAGLSFPTNPFFARLRAGETLALALPSAAPGERAFLLLTARTQLQNGPLPGRLFRFQAPKTAPEPGK